MGTHPSGPSKIKGTGQPLLEWLNGHEESLGKSLVDKFGKDLPFLFKVLSVAKGVNPLI
jgi:mannose-6-phosphate isomerase